MTQGFDPHRYQFELDRALGVTPEDRAFLARGTLGTARAEAIVGRLRGDVRTKLALFGLGFAISIGTPAWVYLAYDKTSAPLLLLCSSTAMLFVGVGVLVSRRHARDAAAIRAGAVACAEGTLEKTYVPGSKGAAPQHLVRAGASAWFEVPATVAGGVATGRPHRILFVPGTNVLVALDLLG